LETPRGAARSCGRRDAQSDPHAERRPAVWPPAMS
jgi:hypothetical protein